MAAKRAIDVVCGRRSGGDPGAPIMLLTALAVKLTSRGPVFYHQQRVGLHGRVFTVHKFRSMRQDAEAGDRRGVGDSNDDRVSRRSAGSCAGRGSTSCRSSGTCCVGDMSLVGPRPERPEFVSQLTEQIPFYGQRHVVKPGLTGWAQVRYTYGASVEDAMEKLQYDLFYIKNMSMALDVVIVLETIKTVVLRAGAR